MACANDVMQMSYFLWRSLSSLLLFPLFFIKFFTCFLFVSSTFSFAVIFFFFIPLSLLLSACFSSLLFSLGNSDCCQIFKASPHALFLCISMHWWALNNIHSQQTFKRAWLASYMMGWCAVLLLLGALVFWRRERERDRQRRERFGSFMQWA